MATIINLSKKGDGEAPDMSLLKYSPEADDDGDAEESHTVQESMKQSVEFMKEVNKSNEKSSEKRYTTDQRNMKKLQIKRYGQRFKDKVEPLRNKINNMSNLDDNEIDALLDEVRLSISSVNYKAFVHGAFNGTITMYETLLCQMSPVKPVGISALLNPSINEEIADILSELEIEYMPSVKYTTPLVRLAFAITAGTAQCHARQMLVADSKKSADIKETLSKPMDEAESGIFEGL